MTLRLLPPCLLTAALLAVPVSRAADPSANEPQVALEVRFVSVSDNCFKQFPRMRFLEEIKKAETAGDCRFVRGLTELEAFLFLEIIQADKDSHVLSSPKVATADHQTASVDAMDKRTFTTGTDVAWDGERMVVHPHKEAVPLGVRLSAVPSLSPDRKTVLMSLEAALYSLESDPPTTSTVSLSPSADKNIVIERPVVSRLTVDTSFSVEEGKTALLGGWTRKCPPAITWGECVSIEKIEEKMEHVLILVTPRLLRQPDNSAEEQEEKPVHKIEATPTKDDDPPDDATILRVMPPLPAASPLYEVSREDVNIVTHLQKAEEKVSCFGEPYTERTWKCTVFYNEVIESTYPFAFRCKKPRVECFTLTTGNKYKLPKVLVMPSPCY